VKFSRDPRNEMTIRRVERGLVHIGERSFESSVALTADRIVDDLFPASPETLDVADLEPLLASDPEVLVIGTGWSRARPPSALTFALARRGVGLEVMDTPAACRTFNILVSEGRRPAALLIID